EEALNLGYPLMHILNPDMGKDEYAELLDIVTSEGEIIVGLFEDQHLVGLVGYWICHQIWCGKFLEPDHLIVDPACRGKGYGRLLMDYLEQKAREYGCKLVLLKSYKANAAATAFYQSLGYVDPGNVFVKPL